jgi:AcrR family transcriptional regulator
MNELVSNENVMPLSASKEDAPVNRAEKRVAKTRNRLLSAALSFFSEYGIDASTVNDITERADLGKGTFYRHFSDKYEIAACLIEQAIEHIIEKLKSFDKPFDNIEDLLEHLLNVHYHFFIEHNEEFILLFQGRLYLKLQRQLHQQIEAPFSKYLQEIEKLLVNCIPQKVDMIRIRQLACAVAGFVFGFFSFAMIGMKGDELEEFVKPLRQSFIRSLSLLLKN